MPAPLVAFVGVPLAFAAIIAFAIVGDRDQELDRGESVILYGFAVTLAVLLIIDLERIGKWSDR